MVAIARRPPQLFRFQKDRFPPFEVVFINLAYRPGESPLLIECQGSCRDFAGTKLPPLPASRRGAAEALILWRTVSSYYTRDPSRCECCSSILSPLICQITLALEEGTLVSDFGVNGRS